MRWIERSLRFRHHKARTRDGRTLNRQTRFSRRVAESQRRRGGTTTAFHAETLNCPEVLPNTFLPLAPFLPFSAPLRLCASLILLET